MTTRQPTGATHRISKISDLIDVPADAIDDCLSCIRQAIMMCREFISSLGVDSDDARLPYVDWTDDGDNTLTDIKFGVKVRRSAFEREDKE